MTSDFTHRPAIAAHFYNSGKVNKLHFPGYKLPCSSVWLHIDAQNLIKIGISFLGVLLSQHQVSGRIFLKYNYVKLAITCVIKES